MFFQMSVETLPPPELRFALLVAELRKIVWTRQLGLTQSLVMLIMSWTVRMDRRFQALAAMVRAGTLMPPRTRASRAGDVRSGAAGEPPNTGSARPRITSGPRWLYDVLPDRWVMNSLRQLLLDPDMLALLAEAPERFARIVRPLCRALGVRLDELPSLPFSTRRRRAAAAPSAAAPSTAGPSTAGPSRDPRPDDDDSGSLAVPSTAAGSLAAGSTGIKPASRRATMPGSAEPASLSASSASPRPAEIPRRPPGVAALTRKRPVDGPRSSGLLWTLPEGIAEERAGGRGRRFPFVSLAR